LIVAKVLINKEIYAVITPDCWPQSLGGYRALHYANGLPAFSSRIVQTGTGINKIAAACPVGF
jgi:hypothetical protein